MKRNFPLQEAYRIVDRNEDENPIGIETNYVKGVAPENLTYRNEDENPIGIETGEAVLCYILNPFHRNEDENPIGIETASAIVSRMLFTSIAMRMKTR